MELLLQHRLMLLWRCCIVDGNHWMTLCHLSLLSSADINVVVSSHIKVTNWACCVCSGAIIIKRGCGVGLSVPTTTARVIEQTGSRALATRAFSLSAAMMRRTSSSDEVRGPCSHQAEPVFNAVLSYVRHPLGHCSCARHRGFLMSAICAHQMSSEEVSEWFTFGTLQDGDSCPTTPSGRRELNRWHSGSCISEGQAAVELFYRLNHARQTVDYVRRQVGPATHPFPASAVCSLCIARASCRLLNSCSAMDAL